MATVMTVAVHILRFTFEPSHLIGAAETIAVFVRLFSTDRRYIPYPES
ncbi:hypothetical protein NF699_09970 [Sphingomonadaceae bacterium OTU29LAMAA1]|nr:hypothetical protein [Sphingomonas sp. Leaf37]USU03419.1 hypothetical protein NF699_09970 [Sphingomonadaceae bacterium OTU29LAMAA1]